MPTWKFGMGTLLTANWYCPMKHPERLKLAPRPVDYPAQSPTCLLSKRAKFIVLVAPAALY